MTALLSISHLRRTFGTLPALAGLELHLPPGARHAVTGPNGAGKTTLLHLIAGTMRPTAGRITFDGRDITPLGAAHRSRLGIARTFQTPALCTTLSVLDNVILGAWRHVGASRPTGTGRRHGPGAGRLWPGRYRRLATHCRRQLDSLGIAHLADQAVHTLSHGQRRLLEIAVALSGRPRLLLLDEPAAGLDDADLPRLLSCLRQLPAETTVLLVEHHQQVVAAVADTVTVLHHGHLLATGSPAGIAADPLVAEVYLGTAVTREGR